MKFSVEESAVLNRGIDILREKCTSEIIDVKSSVLVRTLCLLHLSRQEREVFGVFFLNSQHRLIEYHDLFFGTIDSATVHIREVAKLALTLNAKAIILTHNHPSGCLNPSEADIMITKKITEAMCLFDISVLDHILVGGSETLSFAEELLI